MKGKRRTAVTIINVLVNFLLAKVFNIPFETTLKIVILEAVILAFIVDYIYKHYK